MLKSPKNYYKVNTNKEKSTQSIFLFSSSSYHSHGFSNSFVLCSLHPHPLLSHGSQNTAQTQNQKLNFKVTSGTGEATTYRKLAPPSWFTSSPFFEKPGQQLWTSHALTARWSFQHCCFFIRNGQRDHENPWYYFC